MTHIDITEYDRCFVKLFVSQKKMMKCTINLLEKFYNHY
jgi:hypothetical protein